jgi:hypothetical protein
MVFRFFYISHLKAAVLRQEPFIYDAFVSYSEEQGTGACRFSIFYFYFIRDEAIIGIIVTLLATTRTTISLK